jgi:hypothetical protein
MGNRCSEGYVTHPLTTYRRTRDLNATLLASYPFETNILILPTIALPVLCRTEYGFAEEAILLWSKPAIVDRLRFENFTI